VVEIAAVAVRSFAVTPKNDVANNHREPSEAIFAEIISFGILLAPDMQNDCN
jgi:hypothetical protein